MTNPAALYCLPDFWLRRFRSGKARAKYGKSFFYRWRNILLPSLRLVPIVFFLELGEREIGSNQFWWKPLRTSYLRRRVQTPPHYPALHPDEYPVSSDGLFEGISQHKGHTCGPKEPGVLGKIGVVTKPSFLGGFFAGSPPGQG